ncbi:MAG: peptidoglycan editing factor PgeF [Peptococcaceae bacterium]|jgi:YfiH family protein|nr:peptidoglycan editing factor PgeF [Peptococcaceae bacterium]
MEITNTPSINIPTNWNDNPVFTYHSTPTPYLTLNSFSALPNMRHGFSTRWGGVSEDIYATMNLGFKTADKPENIRKNYEMICSCIGLNTGNLTLTDQTHTTNVKIIGKEDIGKGFSLPQDYHDIDGLITDLPGVPLSVVHADCVPLLFADPIRKVIGAAHAGWRGTVGNIAANMIQIFQEHYHSKPKDIYMGIGPSIGFCCYEVDQPVADIFLAHPLLTNSKAIKPTTPGKYHINLQQINSLIAQSAGLLPEHIIDIGLCTNCHKDIFFSHRGHQGKRGLLASLIQITE